MLKVEKGGEVKLYTAYHNSKHCMEDSPPFGYIFAKDEKEALDKAFDLAVEQIKLEKARYENSRKKWGWKDGYEKTGYPDPKKKKDVFVMVVQEQEIVL